jgi:hypothetical protein
MLAVGSQFRTVRIACLGSHHISLGFIQAQLKLQKLRSSQDEDSEHQGCDAMFTGKFTNVSEVHTAIIFRVCQSKETTTIVELLDPEDGSITFLQKTFIYQTSVMTEFVFHSTWVFM